MRDIAQSCFHMPPVFKMRRSRIVPAALTLRLRTPKIWVAPNSPTVVPGSRGLTPLGARFRLHLQSLPLLGPNLASQPLRQSAYRMYPASCKVLQDGRIAVHAV
jgi:hypothetical protein